MENSSFNFTKETIEKIVLPEKGRDTYKDTKERGLILMVSDTGVKGFYIAKNIKIQTGKKYYRKKIGDFPDLSISEARNKVFDLKAAITKGFNPYEEIIKKSEKMTFKELINKYIEDYAKHNTKTWKECLASMNKKADSLYDMEISDIQKSDIQKIFNKVTTNGKYAANRFIEHVRAIFNKAIEWELLDKNPADRILKHKEKKRERYLTSEEIPIFLKALAEENNRLLEDIFIISLLTGARKSNVLAMNWQQINFQDGTWHIPASESKNGKAQSITLVDEAIEILMVRKKDAVIHNMWVFPSNLSKSGHFESPKRIWKKVLKRAGFEGVRIHDLRRTHGCWMRKAGADREIIGEALNHSDFKSTEVYDIIESDQVKEFRSKAMKNLMSPWKDKGISVTGISKDLDDTERLKQKIKELEQQVSLLQKKV
jgi:integrase